MNSYVRMTMVKKEQGQDDILINKAYFSHYQPTYILLGLSEDLCWLVM